MSTSEEVVKRLFPCEKFIMKIPNVYIAESRKPCNKQEKDRLCKELLQAKLLAESGYTVYLVPEKDTTRKNFDAIVDGRATEFKTVTGSLRRVAGNFSKGLNQGIDVFLKIEQPFSPRKIYSSILEKLKILKRCNALDPKHTDGYVFISCPSVNSLLKWNISEIIEKLE